MLGRQGIEGRPPMSDVFGTVPGTDPVIGNPVDPLSGNEPRPPSKAGYWIGALLIAAGVIGAIVWIGYRALAFDEAIDDFERVPVGQVGTISLDEGDFVVYAERGAGEPLALAVGEVRMRPAGERGQRVEFEDYDTEFTYDFGGNRVGRAQYTFEIEEAGDYQVAVEDLGSATTAAFGPSVAGDLVAIGVGATVIGGVGVIAGIVVLVVTSSRRRKWRRRNWLDAAGPSPSTWNQPAQQGWGPPPAPGTWNPPPAGPTAYPPPTTGTGYPPPPSAGSPPPTPPIP